MSSESQSDGQTPQKNLQETPSETQGKKVETPTEDKEELKYTETQWRSMQKNIRKEIQPLKDRISELEASNAALEGQAEDVEVLKEMVAKLHGELEDGVPDDSKETVSKYLKKMAALTESEVRQGKERKKIQTELDGYKKKELEAVAQKLATDNGLELDELLVFSDVRDMKAYALDHRVEKPAVVEKPEGTTEPENVEVPPETKGAERPPAPVASAGGVLGDAEFWKQYGQPGYSPTAEEHKRAKQLRDRAIQGG